MVGSAPQELLLLGCCELSPDVDVSLWPWHLTDKGRHEDMVLTLDTLAFRPIKAVEFRCANIFDREIGTSSKLPHHSQGQLANAVWEVPFIVSMYIWCGGVLADPAAIKASDVVKPGRTGILHCMCSAWY